MGAPYGGFFTPGASLASMAGAGPFLSPLGEGLTDFAKFSPSVQGPVNTLQDLPAEAWTRLGQAPAEGYQRRTFAHFVNVEKPLCIEMLLDTGAASPVMGEETVVLILNYVRYSGGQTP